MDRPYAKLAVESGADDRIGELAECNPLGLGLFLLSILKGYPYGILPGTPRAYRAAVIPAAVLDNDDVQRAIDAQVEVGMVHRYEADGKPLLYIRNYHRYQDVQWFRVRASEVPLPECWLVPPLLQEYIDDGALLKASRQLGEYGVEGIPRAAQGSDPQMTLSGGSPGSVTTETPPSSSSSSSSNSSTTNDVQPLSPAPAARATTPPPSDAEQLQTLEAHVDPDDRPLLEEFALQWAQKETKTGVPTIRRRIIVYTEMLALRADLGEDPWRYGMREALKHTAPYANYVIKAAGSWVEHRGSDARKPPPPRADRPQTTRSGSWRNVIDGEEEDVADEASQ